VASRSLVIASVSVLLGSGVAFFNMLEWSFIQNSVVAASDPESIVSDFFVAQALSTVLVVTGLFQIYKMMVAKRGAETPSLLSVMGDALASKKALRIGVVVAVAYAAVYSFFSSLIVYQPGVNFAQTYGVSQPGWAYVACCGDVGTVPKLIVYLSPSLHLGMQLVPLTLLFLFMVPILVGFNAVLSFYALRVSSFPLSGRWLVSSGAVVGLFTACPTCAGLFLASSVGGIGTTLAVALAPYQLLFVAITLPVLLFGPLFTALSVKRSYEASCRLPVLPVSGKIPSG
jgi:hypothetical protein